MSRRDFHATCRLQINGDFTLHDARAVLDHLRALGISHVYLSPIFEARQGSTHGYDVVDPTRVRADAGGEPALRELAAAAADRGMGILLDNVPNHMAASVENPWWRDLLRLGPASPYAAWFDIAWGDVDPFPLVLAMLGETRSQAIDAGAIRLVEEDLEPELAVYDSRYPLAPGTVDEPRPGENARDRLVRILERQHYRLAHWTEVSRTIGYRRFFDVGDLVAFRVEEEGAWAASHAALERWTADGVIDGLRIDHIDGLADPAGYLSRLSARARTPDDRPAVVVVEKILARHETLPDGWRTAGTTGYELIDRITGLLVDPDGWDRLRAHHARRTGRETSFEHVARAARLHAVERLFPAELNALATTLHAIAREEGRDDLDPAALRAALRAVTLGLHVYRTYISGRPGAEDRAGIEAACADAAAHGEATAAALDVLRRVLLREGTADDGRPARFVEQWQQFTGPVMAKGFEDTALYNWSVLTAANEVGGDPGRPCIAPAEVHAFLALRARGWPGSLNATATHDTKRGEDVRARLYALSEYAGEWMAAADEWLDGALSAAPATRHVNPDDTLLIAQAIIGAWPLEGGPGADFRDRLQAYALKAVREAKRETSWRAEDAAYEHAVAELVDALLAAIGTGRATGIDALLPRLCRAGALNSLAQVLVRCAAPGVPDLYRGNEAWRFDLVDPDNRRAIDFDALARLRQSVEPLLAAPGPERVLALLEHWRDGAIKLFVTAAALRFRRARGGLLREGEYLALETAGTRADRVFAFHRRSDGARALAAVPRQAARLVKGWPLGNAWSDTRIELPEDAPPRWRSVLTGETIEGYERSLPVDRVFATLPIALLEPA